MGLDWDALQKQASQLLPLQSFENDELPVPDVRTEPIGLAQLFISPGGRGGGWGYDVGNSHLKFRSHLYRSQFL